MELLVVKGEVEIMKTNFFKMFSDYDVCFLDIEYYVFWEIVDVVVLYEMKG